MRKCETRTILGLVGSSGCQKVFVGFAPAHFLAAASFADVLNEETGGGYQRPINIKHSRGFKSYIATPHASTIPLVFNLRSELSEHWKIRELADGNASLEVDTEAKCLAQVDCQHRLGGMGDSELVFPFMSFIGLDLRSEMALFNVINSKAKGLSSSLTDYHQTKLIGDLEKEAPHLLITNQLNTNPNSPWYRLVRLGGENTSGLMRRTSFRMLQTTIRKFLRRNGCKDLNDVESQYDVIASFWHSVRRVFSTEWDDHRHHLLTKGVGLYSLMEILGDLVERESRSTLSEDWFVSKLSALRGRVDWKSKGMFAHAGGRKGAHEIYQTLKALMENEDSTG